MNLSLYASSEKFFSYFGEDISSNTLVYGKNS